MDRAYSILTVKAVDDEQRIIRGVATTPSPDRVGDVVEPLGVKFNNPMPLLHQHDSSRPVGSVVFDAPTDKGITFTATMPKIADAGPLKDRVDTAWGEVKAGLVRAVSIGFRALDDGYELMRNGGIRFLKTEVMELSLVTIPAQSEAVITAVKQFDVGAPAATGHEGLRARANAPGVTGNPQPETRKGARQMPTIAEQISAFEAKRQAKAARMSEIMTKAAEEGLTLDAAQEEEYDGLAGEVEAIDKHLGRLAVQEKSQAVTARPVAGVKSAADGAAARQGIQVMAKKAAPGIRFARVVKCLGMAQGNRREALEYAKEHFSSDEDVVAVLKAAVTAGGTGTWAGALVGDETQVFADFVEFLRPRTILGRFGQNGIPALRTVPFRTALLGQTAGGQGYWVGEGAAKPLTSFDFARTTLEPLKVANIAVLTNEILRSGAPAADGIVRDQLAAALSSRLDIDFVNPAKTAVAGISPASVTNGATAIASTGNDADAIRTDVRSVFAAFITALNAPTTGVWIMGATNALAASMMVNPLGQAEFPGLTMNGGTFMGLPVIVSEHVGTVVALVNAQDIYLGDEGGIRVDMSTEASLQMDNAATGSSVTGTGVAMVSMFQTNSVAFLAEREINWARRRPSAVAYLTGVTWGAAEAP